MIGSRHKGFLAGYRDVVRGDGLITRLDAASKRWFTGYNEGQVKAREDLETRKRFVREPDPFPTEIAPEYLEDRPALIERDLAESALEEANAEVQRLRGRLKQIELLANWPHSGYWKFESAMEIARAALNSTPQSGGGDAVADSSEVSDVISQRGAGESGSPLSDFAELEALAAAVIEVESLEDASLGDLASLLLFLRGDGWKLMKAEPSPESGSGEEGEACYSCGEKAEGGKCCNSKRPCGHHCNCSWVHDRCHWCGEEFGEEPTPTQPFQGSEVERYEVFCCSKCGKPQFSSTCCGLLSSVACDRVQMVRADGYTALQAQLQRVEEERDRAKRGREDAKRCGAEWQHCAEQAEARLEEAERRALNLGARARHVEALAAEDRAKLYSPYCKDPSCPRGGGKCDHPKRTWKEQAEINRQAALDRRSEGRENFLRAERAEAPIQEVVKEFERWAERCFARALRPSVSSEERRECHALVHGYSSAANYLRSQSTSPSTDSPSAHDNPSVPDQFDGPDCNKKAEGER